MLKLEMIRGDILKKLIALIIILASLFGGFYIYQKINNNYGTPYVTITFDVNGEITKTKVLRGESVEEPVVPSIEGYTFIGWDNDASFDLVTKDQTYKAVYEINKYTISFNTKCDYVVESIQYDYNESINDFVKPTRNGYEFVGWYYQGVLFENKTMPAYDVELDAVWYSTITFAEVEGIKFEPLKGIAGESISAPIIKEEDKRPGETIVWYKDHLYQDLFTFNRMPEDNIILYGRFEEIKVVDPGFLDNLVNNELSNIITTYEELVDYLEYLVYHRVTVPSAIVIEFDVDNTQTVLNKAFDDINLDTYIRYSGSRKGNVYTIKLEFEEEATQKASLTNLYQQLECVEKHKQSTRPELFNDFAIDKLTKTYKVTNSEQLYYLVERGYKPEFQNNIDGISDVRKIYEEARYILRNIIDDDMNEYEKVHAIYDWLVLNVTYDKRLKDYVEGNIGEVRKYRGFYLEGVFLDKRAVCDGIAKAFVLMCRIEGIEAIRVEGVAVDGSFSHAWNKVRIDNVWYIVDATSGGTIVENFEIMNHKYLFTNEDFYGSMFVATTYTDAVAYGEYNIYEEIYFTYDGYKYDFNITSQNELNMIIKWYISNFYENTTIDLRIAFDIGETIEDELKIAMKDTNLNYLVPILTDNDVLLIKEFKLK